MSRDIIPQDSLETTALTPREIHLPKGAELIVRDGFVLGLELPPDLPFDGVEALAAYTERQGLVAIEACGRVFLVEEEVVDGEVVDAVIVDERHPDSWTALMRDIFGYIDWLADQSSVSQLILGDAMAQGEAAYGEKYDAWMDQTGFAYGSLANIVWVAENVPPQIRVPGLTFYHYRMVAALDDTEAKRGWLEKALEERWSGRDLGTAIMRQALVDQGLDPDLYEAERGVGRAVRALKDLDPALWAEVVWHRFLWPLRHATNEADYSQFLAQLGNHLSEGG